MAILDKQIQDYLWEKDMRIKQCCSCEKVFKKFHSKEKAGIYGLCPNCFSGNWVYGYID